jgi:selenocysteine-specific elongation factor
VVRTTPELYFAAPSVAALRERLVAHLRSRREITTQEFKDLVGATRKHVIPLAEYFDREKVTLRIGERRVLRGEGK